MGMILIIKQKGYSTMKNSTKKAVILNNFSSPYIYQTIVILNENGILNESRALRDAEKIVSDYLKSQNNSPKEDTLVYSRQKVSNKKKYRFFKSLLIGTFISGLIFLFRVLFK